MKRTDQQNLLEAAKIVAQIRYGVVACADADGRPWVSPLYVVHDDALNFYWFSDRTSRHSRNVRQSGRAAMVIFDSTVPEGAGLGVYLEGSVRQLEAVDRPVIELARQVKKGELPSTDYRRYTGRAARRVYQFVPEAAWINATQWRDGRFVRDVRVSLGVADLAQACVGRV